jgi:hypothetical protein
MVSLLGLMPIKINKIKKKIDDSEKIVNRRIKQNGNEKPVNRKQKFQKD